MSHSARIIIISDQEIRLCGKEVNIHDIESVTLDDNGHVVGFTLLRPKRILADWEIIKRGDEWWDDEDKEWIPTTEGRWGYTVGRGFVVRR